MTRVSGCSGLTAWTYFTGSEGRVESLKHLWLIVLDKSKRRPTKQNPSDLVTRGLSVSALAEEDKWWSGPAFLKQDPSEWPENKIETKRALDVEIRKSHQIKGRTEERAFLSSSSEDRLEPQRYSSLSKLTRVSARVNRFIENCRLPVAPRRGGALQPGEVISAGMRFIRQAQEGVFKEEM